MELVRPPRSQASGRLKSAANAIDSEARLTVKAVKTSLSLSFSLCLLRSTLGPHEHSDAQPPALFFGPTCIGEQHLLAFACRGRAVLLAKSANCCNCCIQLDIFN